MIQDTTIDVRQVELPRGTHRWSMFQNPREIEAHLAKGGLLVRNAVGVAANPVARSLRVTRSMAVNYTMVCTRTA